MSDIPTISVNKLSINSVNTDYCRILSEVSRTTISMIPKQSQ